MGKGIKYKFVIYLLCTAIGALFFSCTDDTGVKPVTVAGKTTVRFLVSPGAMVTRAGVATENTVDRLVVLVFEEQQAESGTYLFSYQTEAVADGNDYTAELEATDRKVKLCLLANVTGLSITEGDEYATALASVTETFSPAGPDYIPMYGEVVLDKLEEETALTSAVQLIRALAAVHIELPSEVADIFTLTSVQAFRANNLYRVVPDGANLDGENPKVTAPTVPVTATTSVTTGVITVSNGTTAFEGLYLPEANLITDEAEQTSAATCLVIGGIYTGDNPGNTTETFYRIDFVTITGSNFGQLLRNHKYYITLTQISEPGESSADIAAANPGKGVNVNIFEMDDDNGIIVGPDGTYFSLAVNPVRVNYFEGATRTVEVITNAMDSGGVEYSIQWVDEGNQPVSAAAIPGGAAIENDHFSLAISESGDNITVTALSKNDTGELRTEKAMVTVGSMNILFTVIQQLPSEHERDYINVFNFTQGTTCTLGDEVLLAVSGGAYASNAPVLSALMKNTTYFGKEGNTYGTIPFGGFFISGVPTETEMTGQLADLFDFIFIAENTEYWRNDNRQEYSENFFSVLLDWVEYSPNRVLMTAFDNIYMPNVMPITTNNWGPDTASGDCIIADEIPPSILNGPFGKVTAETISTPKNAWGVTSTKVLNRDTNPDLTPILLVKDNSTNKGMALCVDEQRGIIYYGDQAWFLAGNGTFSTDGTIDPTNDADILMANLLAWIADTIMGEKLAPDVE